MAKKPTYNAEAIRVLTDGEHLRLRPAMYVGSTDQDGIYQIVKEAIDNSLDEYLAGHADAIEVGVTGNTVRVSDNGRGIPVEQHAQTGVSTLTTVLTNLQAGGKFDQKTYAVSAGLHGVGIKATNYLSSSLRVWVRRNHKLWFQEFERGQPVAPVSEVTDPAVSKVNREFNTTIEFTPDPEIFGTSVLDTARLQRMLYETSALCPKLRIRFTLNGVTQDFVDVGLPSILDVPTEDQLGCLSFQDDRMSLALIWADREDATFRGFVNLTHTPQGGTHIQGLRDALKAVLTGLPGAAALDARDLLTGMVGALHVKVQSPSFHGQTKDKLLTKETAREVETTLRPQIQRFLDQNKQLARNIVERAVRLTKEREQLRKLRAATQTTQTVRRDARGVLPGKLYEATGCTPDERELYICEGNSALGSAVAARDSRCQEVLPLRGKIVNAQRVDVTQVLKNEEIQSIITATGIQIDPKSTVSNLDRLRVGRVLLLCDADPDGLHISTLVLGFFFRFARNLLDSGRIYVVRSPLFRGTDAKGSTYWYADSLTELEAVSGLSATKMQVCRLKGQGEASAQEIGDYAMHPATRRLIQVTSQDVAGRFDALMGSDTDARKELLGLGAVE